MAKIIADISGNHGGNLDKAKDLIKAAADCGCDYAKFQYYFPREMPDYAGNEADYDNLAVSRSWLDPLFAEAARCKILLFASVFQKRGVWHLEPYQPPFFKLASPESTRLSEYGLITNQIRRGTPIIFSTGDADYWSIKPLMISAKDVLLYCPPGHPTPRAGPAELDDYRKGYDGLSDHCADLSNAAFFIDAGAEWIERHLKLDGDCIDTAFSSDPLEMAVLCKRAHK
jgi:N-acetylneuraminate synthase/pseudaminic acid synthase